MDMSKVAVQLYSFRDYCKTPEDLDCTLSKLYDMGYRAVQVSGVACDKDVVAETCKKYRMKICATHVGMDLFRNDIDGLVNLHKLYDCKYAGLGAIGSDMRSTADDYVAFAKEFSAIGEKLHESGLQFVYHNHHFEFRRFGNKTGMDLILENSTPGFGFLLDTYWVQFGGGDPVEWIKKLKNRLKVVHIKDYAVNSADNVEFAAIGEGNLNWKKIINTCEETGVEWYAIEQDTCPRDPFDCFLSSYNYLSGLSL